MTKTKTLTLLLASAALTAAVGVPAWSALHTQAVGEAVAPLADMFGSDGATRPILLADNDADENGSVSRGESSDDNEDCEEEEGNCGGASAKAPAPAGAVPPPQNGLFDNGTAPQVKVK